LLLSSPISGTACGLAYRKAKLPEGAGGKGILPPEPAAKIKTFDSSTSPSGLLERLVSWPAH